MAPKAQIAGAVTAAMFVGQAQSVGLYPWELTKLTAKSERDPTVL